MGLLTKNACGRFDLDRLEMRAIALDKFSVRKCPCCDNNGMIYYDGETGLGVSSSPSGINPEWLTSVLCDECEGVGYKIKVKAEIE